MYQSTFAASLRLELLLSSSLVQWFKVVVILIDAVSSPNPCEVCLARALMKKNVPEVAVKI